jgi:hypothetical protein
MPSKICSLSFATRWAAPDQRATNTHMSHTRATPRGRASIHLWRVSLVLLREFLRAPLVAPRARSTSHIPWRILTRPGATRVQFLCYKKLKKVLKSLPALNPADLEAPTTSGEHPNATSGRCVRGGPVKAARSLRRVSVRVAVPWSRRPSPLQPVAHQRAWEG